MSTRPHGNTTGSAFVPLLPALSEKCLSAFRTGGMNGASNCPYVNVWAIKLEEEETQARVSV